MDNITVDALLNVLSQLAYHSQEHWMKLNALQRTIEKFPEIQQEYQNQLLALEKDPTIASEHRETAKVLSALQVRLRQQST